MWNYRRRLIMELGGKTMRKFFLLIFIIFLLSAAFTILAKDHLIYVIDISGDIDMGLAHYVERTIKEAGDAGADAIILEINTFGGRVDAATKIRDAVYDSRVQVISFVIDRAWSAGALIALSAPHIAMTPGSSIGAAEPRPADAKTVSALSGEFRALAEKYKRDTEIAAAMVDSSIEIPELNKKRGDILTLTAQQAKDVGYADVIVPGRQELLAHYNFSRNSKIVTKEITTGEQLARFVTSPGVSSILLSIGFLGILIELLTMHGIAGAVGVISLALFFGGHIVAGFSNWVVAVIFAVGVLLILFELHILPGHGISGILGALGIFYSIYAAIGGGYDALKQIAIALTGAVILFLIALRFLPKSEFWHRLTLHTAQKSELGYVSAEEHKELEGSTGITVSELKPGGIILINDKRYDVISEGSFIPPNTKVTVVKIEGSKIVVRKSE